MDYTRHASISLLLLQFLFLSAFGLEVNKIRLTGDSNGYISLQSRARYTLQCKFKADYDDVIHEVRWFKDGQRVYSWQSEAYSSRAFGPLAGRVEKPSRENLENIHFSGPHLDLAGSYICEVRGSTTKKSDPFNLVVLDVASDDFSMEVSLLRSETELDESIDTTVNYTIEGLDNELDALEETEVNPGNCTLVWEFSTPAIFPRPNITCGFYSYLHDDIDKAIPGGLVMHQLSNGSWQAGFEETLIPIIDIPRESRLGCSVSVPNTNYKKIIKFEDNFAIDHLIDSEGCPTGVFDVTYKSKLEVDIEGGSYNCRGDLVPASSTEPLRAIFRCPKGQLAAFPNGSAFYSWHTELYCHPRDFGWASQDSTGRRSSPSSNLTEWLPVCVPMSGCSRTSQSLLLSAFSFVWLVSYLKNTERIMS